MKSVFLFCTKPLVYLTELPVLILLGVAIKYNGLSDEMFKFYPLIAFLCLAIVFIMVYFFRLISISTDEIRYHGIFSSRDRAFINEGKSLVLTIKPKRKLGVELYGDAGSEPAFDWMKAEDVLHRDICIFRGKAIGGIGSAKRVLKYFSLPESMLNDISNNGFYYEDDTIRVNTEIKNELTEITVKFKKTII